MTITRPLLLLLAIAVLLFPEMASARQETGKLRVEIAGFPLSLSPDGTRIAGLDAVGHAFCVWDVDSLEAVCDGEIPDVVEPQSVAWSPDSTAVAFSLGAVNHLVDSDIYVFDALAGILHNVTDDDQGIGADDISFIRPQVIPVAIDRFPAWSPDGQSIIFARTVWGDDKAPGITLMTVPRSGGEPAELAPIAAAAPLAVVGPMSWREDGSILFSTRHPNPRDEQNALWRLEPDGQITRILDGTPGGGITEPILADIAADGVSASVFSRLDLLDNLGRSDSKIFFHVDLASGMTMLWDDYPGVALKEDAVLLAPPVFGPDTSVVFLSHTPDGEMVLSVLDPAGTFTDIASVEYEPGRRPAVGTSGVNPTVNWASDGTLLVILATGGVLLTDGALPAVTVTGT
jgi:WD40 repeat protein